MKALGMIEVYGYVTAVEALDSALKAADVHVLTVTPVKGGYVTVVVTGDVGAVKAAMEASASSAKALGKVLSLHVIPRPVDSIEAMLRPKKAVTVKQAVTEKKEQDMEYEKNRDNGKGIKDQQDGEIQRGHIRVENIQSEIIREEAAKSGETKAENREGKPAIIDKKDMTKLNAETMQGMTVEQLRNLARRIGITNLTRKEIKFANKKQLIQSICSYLEQER